MTSEPEPNISLVGASEGETTGKRRCGRGIRQADILAQASCASNTCTVVGVKPGDGFGAQAPASDAGECRHTVAVGQTPRRLRADRPARRFCGRLTPSRDTPLRRGRLWRGPPRWVKPSGGLHMSDAPFSKPAVIEVTSRKIG